MNSPFIPAPVNVPPAYMTGLRCATSFDQLLVPQTLPPFGMAPSMTSSYASPGFSQYASPYFLNYPYQTIPPVPPATPNPFTQFVPHPSPSFVRPPPGFDPLNFPRPPSSASSYYRPGFVPTPLAPCRIGTQYDDRLPPRSSSHEPLVTIASTATTTTNKFEWPLTDPELASQWKKVMNYKFKIFTRTGMRIFSYTFYSDFVSNFSSTVPIWFPPQLFPFFLALWTLPIA